MADSSGDLGYDLEILCRLAMSEEQLSALLAKVKDDAVLQEKLKGAADPYAAVSIAKEAGFDVSKADLLRYQAKQTIELSNEELEGASGGKLTECLLCASIPWGLGEV